jgi:ssDNA-binding Zn-finger/Zn-ribbon topoisomerase 1
MADIIKINSEVEPVANCPVCGNTQWYIKLNAFGNHWDKITGTQCTQCNFLIKWESVDRDNNAQTCDYR